MEEVIYYLELKNHFYEKFLSISEKFLVQANHDRWDGIESFTDNRERILNIIQSYSHKIASLFDALQKKGVDVDPYRETIQNLFKKRASIGDRILKLDLELMSKIEETKNETIRDLKKLVETSQALNSFAGPSSEKKGSKASKDA